MAKKLCLFCPAMFEPYAPLAKRQRVCEDPECRRRLKRMLEAALLRRRSAEWRKERNKWVREWSKAYPDYWRRYRKGHLAYVRRDNSRRVCSRRRGMSAKPE
jgi:hypothetical protein